MRFERIDLVAFGPFTGKSLDLSSSGPGFHLIYGPNEAGKSSLLRGLGDFLFGVPEKTQDAHLHTYQKLRIGAELSFQSGQRLELVRRKGRKTGKGTLLDAEGEPAEEKLKQLLGPIDRDLFDGLFGLNHVSLREGASALFANQGDAGQSLFDAGSGLKGQNRSIKAIIEEFEKQAEDLYKPRGQLGTLNRALSEFDSARIALGKESLSSEVWQRAQRALEDAKAELKALNEQIQELQRRLRQLDRKKRLTPMLQAHARALQTLGELGELPDIAPDASSARLIHQGALHHQAENIKRLEAKLLDLGAKLDALSIPKELLVLEAAQLEGLRSAASELRSAAQRAPGEANQLEGLQRDIARELEALPEGGDQASQLSTAQRERILAHTQARGALESNLEHAKRATEEAARELAVCQQRLLDLGDCLDGEQEAALQSSLEAARDLGDAEKRLDQVQREVRHQDEDLERCIALLPLWQGTAQAALALGVPSEATLTRCVAAADDLQRALESNREAKRKLAQQLEELERCLETERASQELPSEAKLSASRAQRDTHWKAIRAGQPAEGPAGDALEDSTRSADQLADRLRHEAGRLTQIEHWKADAAAKRRSLAQLEEESTELARRAVDDERTWQAHWSALEGQALAPREMQAWCAELAKIKQLAEARLGAERQAAALAERIAQASAGLVVALEEGGQKSKRAASLPALMQRADKLIEQQREQRSRQLGYSEDLVQAQARSTAAHEGLRSAEQASNAWQVEFSRAIACAGLSLPASNEQVLARLDALARLAELRARADELRARQAQAQHAEQNLESQLNAISAGLAMPLDAPTCFERTDQLLARATRASYDEQQRLELAAEVDQSRIELGAAKAAQQLARDGLNAAIARAGVRHEDELAQVEERVAQKRAAESELDGLAAAIHNAGDQTSIAILERELASLECDDVQQALLDLEAQLSELERLRDAASERAGKAGSELNRMEHNAAAELAEAKQGSLEVLRTASQRYLRLRLAARILREEVEAYREANQGPLLKRISTLFPRLTQGRYSAVRVHNSDDEATLLTCIRGADEAVPIEALSDGTRDQLFLAMRIASIERHLEHGEALPIVLDDILVHFDDERARLALGVLGELAQKTQVLFFTHHARLCELAVEVLGPAVHMNELHEVAGLELANE